VVYTPKKKLVDSTALHIAPSGDLAEVSCLLEKALVGTLSAGNFLGNFSAFS
jgi:hypothetical protein